MKYIELGEIVNDEEVTRSKSTTVFMERTRALKKMGRKPESLGEEYAILAGFSDLAIEIRSIIIPVEAGFLTVTVPKLEENQRNSQG